MAARRPPEPADLRLRHHRATQQVRRAVLAVSVVGPVLAALLHLARLDGAHGRGAWAALARHIPPDVAAHAEAWLGAPWTVRVLGLEILDPVAALSVIAAAGPSRAILLGALPAVALVLVLGRFFCGWMCPYIPLVWLSHQLRALAARLGLRTGAREYPRWLPLALLGAAVVLGALTGTPVAQLYYPPAVIARELPRALYQGVPTLGLLAVGGAVTFDVLVSRAGFCRYLCPGGALFRLLGARSPLSIRRDAARCTDCTACDAVCHLGQSPMTDRTDAACERCTKCVAVCPTHALALGVGHPRLPVVHEERR